MYKIERDLNNYFLFFALHFIICLLGYFKLAVLAV